MVDEKKDIKTVEPVKPVENTQEGDKSKTVSELDRADQIAERMARENDRRIQILDREENLAARKAVGGVAGVHQEPEKPKELTDTEYAEALQKGEVNPLKEDGILK